MQKQKKNHISSVVVDVDARSDQGRTSGRSHATNTNDLQNPNADVQLNCAGIKKEEIEYSPASSNASFTSSVSVARKSGPGSTSQMHLHQQQAQQQHLQQQQHLHHQRNQLEQHEQQQQEHHRQQQQHQHQLTANLLLARSMAASSLAELSIEMKTASPSSPQATGSGSGGGGYLLPCPLCETPLEPRVFRQHLDRHYPRDSPVCPVLQCGRRFAHPNSVRNHMRIKHTLQWAKMKAMRSSGGPFTGMPDFK